MALPYHCLYIVLKQHSRATWHLFKIHRRRQEITNEQVRPILRDYSIDLCAHLRITVLAKRIWERGGEIRSKLCIEPYREFFARSMWDPYQPMTVFAGSIDRLFRTRPIVQR